jgi:hypothetical protein
MSTVEEIQSPLKQRALEFFLFLHNIKDILNYVVGRDKTGLQQDLQKHRECAVFHHVSCGGFSLWSREHQMSPLICASKMSESNGQQRHEKALVKTC